MKAKLYHKLTAALCTLMLLLSLTPDARAADFPDVSGPEWDWARDAIQTCAAQGTVTGYEDGTFGPGDSVTGAQFIVMLTRTFYPEHVAAVTDTAGKDWFYPNVTAAQDLGLTKGLSGVSDTPMSRFDMAQALYNILDRESRTSAATSSQLTEAVGQIKDFYSMPRDYRKAVMYCFALGILSGYEDGSFSGNDCMDRAQACVVITRMTAQLAQSPDGGGAAPVQKPDAPETVSEVVITSEATKTGTKWNISDNQNQTGTLNNGKAITEENVLEIIDMMHDAFPSGMVWCATLDSNNNYYGNPGRAVTNVVGKKYNVDTNYGCGGFAAMVSDAIFGKNANPMRQVTDMSTIRPGDIIVQVYASTGKSSHVNIVAEIIPDGFYTADGNSSGQVIWFKDEDAKDSMRSLTYPGTFRYEVWTRYPE